MMMKFGAPVNAALENYNSPKTPWQSGQKQITCQRDPKHNLVLKTTNSRSPSGNEILHLLSPMEDEYFCDNNEISSQKIP